jgi:anti-sigma B factor antagonist
VEHDGATVRVRLSGEFDLAEEQRFADAMKPLKGRARGGMLLLDLRGLEFMDSTGLRALLELHAESSQDGFGLGIINGTGVVRRVLRVTGLDAVLPMCDDDYEAGDGDGSRRPQELTGSAKPR